MHQVQASPSAMRLPTVRDAVESPSGEQADMIVLFYCAGLTSAVLVLILVERSRDQAERDGKRECYRLSFPRDLTFDQVVAFMRTLAAVRPSRWSLLGRPSLVFEIRAHGGAIEHQLWMPPDRAVEVLTQLRASLPGVRAVRMDAGSRPLVAVAHELGMSDSAVSFKTSEAVSIAASVLGALSVAEDDETIILQVVVSPVGTPTRRPTPARATSKADSNPNGEDTHARRELADKTSEPHVAASVRVGAVSARPGRSRQLASHVVGTLRQLDQANVRLVIRHGSRSRASKRLRLAATPIMEPPMWLNARELAAVVAWPLGGPVVPGLKLTGGRLFAPSPELSQAGYVLGQAVYPGMERPVALTPGDSLMHLLVTGPTGSGKSTLLLNIITQQLAAGNGLVLVDPGGDLARDATDCIPGSRLADLIYVHPGDQQVVGLNPLDCALDDAELVADQLLDLIREHADNWGPVIAETLKATLVLLAATPGMTIVELPAVLLDAGFRSRVLSTLDPAFAPTVGEFFIRYDALSQGQQATAASAALNKVTPLIDRRPIRAMLGQSSPQWTMREVIDQGKILIVALPSGIIGPVAADLVGSVIVTQVWNAALGRQTVSRAARRPVSLVIDELPRFVRGGGMNLADILARARGHGLGLVGAVQHIGQVRPDLRMALMSEARSKVILQPAADDAAVLARHLPGVEPADLLGLPARQALAAVVVRGQVVPPVTIATAPPPEPTGLGDAARMASRTTYGRDRARVERDIAARRRGPENGPRRRTRRIPE
jgi:hypothetical protein